MFLEAIFPIQENVFQSLLCKISLAYKISHFLSANHNPELRFLIWIGVITLFALMLHLICTALSQSKSSNFFHVNY